LVEGICRTFPDRRLEESRLSTRDAIHFYDATEENAISNEFRGRADWLKVNT
jgi:hypothetical protein